MKGLSTFMKRFFQSNYILKPIDLFAVGEVPMEADLLMILAPKTGFLRKRSDGFRVLYKERGGNLLLLLPPLFFDEDISSLLAVLEKQGLKVENKLTLDRLATMQGLDASVPIITNFDISHPITQGFNSRVLFPISSSLIALKKEKCKIHRPC
jgi:hypothetical protein